MGSGALAHLVERSYGIAEVASSSLARSTIFVKMGFVW